MKIAKALLNLVLHNPSLPRVKCKKGVAQGKHFLC